VTKPDADNVVKVMMDSLVAEGYIQADQQVADLRVMKLEWDKGGFIELIIDQPAPFVSA
jgi:Holliday junction resolvase RusA-like endonuclease